jgi:hypothetical protein
MRPRLLKHFGPAPGAGANREAFSPRRVEITYTGLGSMRTVLAWAALGSSMFKIPSFKVALPSSCHVNFCWQVNDP